MDFLWPRNLWWLLALPLLPLLYAWLLRRGHRAAIRFSSVAIARAAAGPRGRRHVPPALVFFALGLLVLAGARPTAPLTLPWSRSTILLALDISRSMRVADVQPTRMAAAQAAAKDFLAEVPAHIEVGVVTFAGSAQVAQRATLDRPSLVFAIDNIQMQLGTAIGSAIVVCLSELFPGQGFDLGAISAGPRPVLPAPPAVAVAPGAYDAAAIILLSDGRRTMGVDTLAAARLAADRGVRIHVVGLGTPDGHLAMGDEMAIYLQLDEPTLRKVAELTGGEYHRAASAEALRGVYRTLGSQRLVRRLDTELTAVLAVLAAAVLAAAVALSLWWFGRVA